MDIITRAEWGAEPKRGDYLRSSRIQRVFVHHSAGPPTQSVKAIERYHIYTKRWNGIAYTMLVDDAGRVYEGRGLNRTGAHTQGWNSRSYAVCFIGRSGDVTPAAFASINWTIGYLFNSLGRPVPVYGHRDVGQTACPGDQLYAWIQAGRPGYGGSGTSEEEELMSVRNEIIGAIQAAIKEQRVLEVAEIDSLLNRVIGEGQSSEKRVNARVDEVKAAVAEIAAALADAGIDVASTRNVRLDLTGTVTTVEG